MSKAIGILGGMGPQATVDAMNKIIKNTPANRDQEHIPVIAVSIPDIPDRTECIENHNDAPLKKMKEYLHILENADVGCVIIPCNTAHYWFDQLRSCTSTKMISIIESVTDFVKSESSTLMILGTTATINTELYQQRFSKCGIKFTTPQKKQQQQIMQSIYLYKSGDIAASKKLMNEIIDLYQSESNYKFLLACTEIPLILQERSEAEPEAFIDATDVLIKSAIQWYQQSELSSVA